MCLRLPCVRNRHMSRHAHIKRHCCPVVEVATPVGNVVFISVHLDAFAGRAARRHQFGPIQHLVETLGKPCIVGGDLNTHNTGIALLVNRCVSCAARYVPRCDHCLMKGWPWVSLCATVCQLRRR